VAAEAQPVSMLNWETGDAAIAFTDASPSTTTRRATARLFNPGPMPAVLGTTSVIGPQAPQFRIDHGCERGSVLQAGTSCELTLSYSPNSAHAAESMLQLRSDQGNPGTLRLEGPSAATPAEPVPSAVPTGGGGSCSIGPPGTRQPDVAMLLALATAIAWLARGRGAVQRPKVTPGRARRQHHEPNRPPCRQGWSILLQREQFKCRIDHVVRDLLQLLSRQVLDRMRHIDHRRVEAQRVRLHLKGVDERIRDDAQSRHPTRIHLDEVVQTARRARPSVG